MNKPKEYPTASVSFFNNKTNECLFSVLSWLKDQEKRKRQSFSGYSLVALHAKPERIFTLINPFATLAKAQEETLDD